MERGDEISSKVCSPFSTVPCYCVSKYVRICDELAPDEEKERRNVSKHGGEPEYNSS